MEARTDRYAPSAGIPQPNLAERDDLLEKAAVALDRVRNGLATKNLLMVGLRGVGKTALLNRMCRDAEIRGFTTAMVKASQDSHLPRLLVAPLYAGLTAMNRANAPNDANKSAHRALASFACTTIAGFDGLSVNIDADAEPGVADSGHLESDLGDLLTALGHAAKSQSTAVALFIDELQRVEKPQLAALIAALHRTAQQRLPVILIGAGLPQLVAQVAEAKPYAERLFSLPEIGPPT